MQETSPAIRTESTKHGYARNEQSTNAKVAV